jgi:hypothetical protein
MLPRLIEIDIYQLAPKICSKPKISALQSYYKILANGKFMFIAIGIFLSTACGVYLFNVGSLNIDENVCDQNSKWHILDHELRSVYGNIVNVNSKEFPTSQNKIYYAMVNLQTKHDEFSR